jgi:hypothetical protein
MPAVVRPGGNPVPNEGDDFVDEAMLAEALAKARKLVAEMERQQAEVEASPPKISPEQLAAGKFAFEKALASGRRMLKALEDAAEIAQNASNSPLNGPPLSEPDESN